MPWIRAAAAMFSFTTRWIAAAASPSVSPSPSAAGSPSPEALQRREPSLPAPVEETAAAAAGGKLYVMGGFNGAGQSLSTVYVFDGSRWTAGPRLPLPLDHASAATLDGHVYIAGGHSNGGDSARLFRLDGNRWTALAPMHHPRGGHALVALDGALYAVGGNTSGGNVAQLESFDADTNTWSVVAVLPQPRNHVAGFVIGMAVCVAGGRSPNTSRVDCYDTLQHLMFHPPSLPFATSGAGATTFGEIDAIVLGGEDAAESRLIDRIAIGKGGAWRLSTERMLVPRHGFQLAMFNGRAWACGGGTIPGLHPVATCTSLGGDWAGSES
jgi:non-specific serine/threonine protein kinase